MAGEADQDAPQANGKATGGLKPATASLIADAVVTAERPHFVRSLALRFAETAIFLVAVIGAIALGLGITAYFAEHRYVVAYLAAYAGLLQVLRIPEALVLQAWGKRVVLRRTSQARS